MASTKSTRWDPLLFRETNLINSQVSYSIIADPYQPKGKKNSGDYASSHSAGILIIAL